MLRRSPLKRNKPLASGGPLRRSPIRRVSEKRLAELKRYWARIPGFLAEHPVCQIWLAEHGFTEADLTKDPAGQWCVRIEVPDLTQPIAVGARAPLKEIRLLPAPRSEVVHHRNKRRGARLLDESEWIAASRRGHGQVEGGKAWARQKGYLRPF